MANYALPLLSTQQLHGTDIRKASYIADRIDVGAVASVEFTGFLKTRITKTSVDDSTFVAKKCLLPASLPNFRKLLILHLLIKLAIYILFVSF